MNSKIFGSILFSSNSYKEKTRNIRNDNKQHRHIHIKLNRIHDVSMRKSSSSMLKNMYKIIKTTRVIQEII